MPSEAGRTTRKLILDMIEAARALSREPQTYWTDQLNNHDSIAGYCSLAEEIWSGDWLHSSALGPDPRG